MVARKLTRALPVLITSYQERPSGRDAPGGNMIQIESAIFGRSNFRSCKHEEIDLYVYLRQCIRDSLRKMKRILLRLYLREDPIYTFGINRLKFLLSA